MKKFSNIFVTSAVIAYALKFMVEVVMYVYTIYNKSEIYYDDWYLFLPQVVSAVLLTVFYSLFMTRKFYGVFIKLSAFVMILLNLMFIGILIYDRTLGYVFYFALVAAVNFLNALFIKCNIIPARKPGAIEYGPMIFEIVSFVAMAVSLYSVFCGFPLSYNKILHMWDYYDSMGSMKMNIVSAGVILLQYIMCLKNDSEYVRDNMFDEPMLLEESEE
ncbi:MAG: hypothetical protein IKA95_03905 [Clostridia bacterium]|nr:hypothetical protein [Clostridia bacterium]